MSGAGAKRGQTIFIKDVDLLSGAEAIRGGGIGVGADGRIAFVLRAGEAPPQGFAPDRTLDGRGKLAIPGFVNAHCHSAMVLLRGFADDIRLEEWLFERVFPAEAKMTEEDIRCGTELAIAEMLLGGVTCFHEMYLKMDVVAQAIADSGMRAVVSMGPLFSEARGGANVDVAGCKAFFARWGGAAGGRLTANMEVHSVYLYKPEALREGAALAQETGVGVHIHILETAEERRNMLAQRGRSSVYLAAEYGLLDAPRGVVAAHCVHVDDGEIAVLAEKGVGVAHCPTSNLKLASGIAPVPKMLAAGVNVCLGTDGAASNNRLSVMAEMRLAALLHKGAAQDPLAVPAAQAFQMATRNGARALGLAADVGEIAPGKKADIALVNMGAPHVTPCYDALSTLVYSARASDVDTVLVDGVPLVEGGACTTVDVERASRMVAAATAKFRP